MKLLLIFLIVFLTASSVFDWDPGPAPGLKIKNAILYMLTLGVFLRIAIDRRVKFELPELHAAFAVLILYAIGSYLAVVPVIHYPHYDSLESALNLKGLLDQLLFFMVFFYGVRSDQDAVQILKWLVAAWVLSHIMALLDAVGVVQFGDIEMREDGRVQGLVGESNQYGAFVALTLPAVISLALLTRGPWRTFWGVAALVTAMTLVMTVSRGAFVAVIAAGLWGAYMFRGYARRGRLLAWTGGIVAVTLTVVVTVIALGFGDLLYERLVQSTNSSDMVGTSSGRTQIWANAIGTMFNKPITLLSGYGWRSYWSMPFRYSPHNHYVNQWFNLGLVGLATSVLLFVMPIRTALAAMRQADAAARTLLIGFVMSALAFAVSTFFVDLYSPWMYFWAYAGVALRVAMNSREQQSQEAPAPVRTRPTVQVDQHGWVAAGAKRIAGQRS